MHIEKQLSSVDNYHTFDLSKTFMLYAGDDIYLSVSDQCQ